MREQIYTIPINEAYDADCECPLCLLQKRTEEEAIEYALGAAMMEPDYRTESNEKGYCRRHFEELFAKPNKLSLALVLDTHFEETRKSIEQFKKRAEGLKNSTSGGLFKKSGAQELCEELSGMIAGLEKSCIVCDKLSYTMGRYYDVLLDMWAEEPEFRKKFSMSKGVCLPHMRELLERAPKNLSKKKLAEFVSELFERQSVELARIQEDIHRFTLKFDYRNKDMEWGTAKDAPIRTIEKTVGYIRHDE